MATEYKLPYSGADIYRRLRDVDTKAKIMPMTTAEFEAIEERDANALYVMTDGDNQVDWNQNDENALDYIKNRPFYEESDAWVTLLPSTAYNPFTFSSMYNAYVHETLATYELTIGEKYKVTWDGVEYECAAQDAGQVMSGAIVLGNASAFGLEGNDEPFALATRNGYVAYMSNTDDDHTVAIEELGTIIHKIDSKYLSDDVAFKEDIPEVLVTSVNGMTGDVIIDVDNSSTQSDWNQNDETAPDYVKNRPFYAGDLIETYLDICEDNLSWMDAMSIDDLNHLWTAQIAQLNYTFENGKEYSFKINGEKYTYTAILIDDSTIGVGDVYGLEELMQNGDASNFNNVIVCYPTRCMIAHKGVEPPVEFKIIDFTQEIVKIDSKYLPEMDIIGAKGVGEHAEVFNDNEPFLAYGEYSHLEGYHKALYTEREFYGDANATTYTLVGSNSTFDQGVLHSQFPCFYNNKLVKFEDFDIGNNTFTVSETLSDTEVTGKLQMYRCGAFGNNSHVEGNSSIATGVNAHAEGSGANAAGNSAHAEGMGTYASGSWSHAEGEGSSATGMRSHAEGQFTQATNTNAHAEGGQTYATGINSHAEGEGSNAQGQASHAEGRKSVAFGVNSHAEGYRTYAASPNQHVQGKANIKDTKGRYAHIVGNGIPETGYDSDRSNAYTLDWDGNAWFQGDVFVGGTSQDDGDRLVKLSEIADIGGSNTSSLCVTVAHDNYTAATSDKTFEEINQAYLSGTAVYVKLKESAELGNNTLILYPTHYQEDMIEFSSVVNNEQVYSVSFTATGDIAVDVRELGSGGGSEFNGDADTLDGKHADEFAAATDVEELRELIENIPATEQVEVDATLSQEGKAADAKAVGDAIKETKEYASNSDIAILAEAQKSVDALAASIQYLTATDDGNGIITLGFGSLTPASEVTF